MIFLVFTGLDDVEDLIQAAVVTKTDHMVGSA
jgi:hypothetical protein